MSYQCGGSGCLGCSDCRTDEAIVAELLGGPHPLDVIGADDVATMLKLDRKSVYEGARNGDIPCKRVGRRFIFCRGAITAWLLETKGVTT